MASIRKRGSSYLIVVSMGYDYNGKRIKSQQKTVHPPAVKVTDEEIFVKEPKTRAGNRYVYFSAEMESLLREYQKNAGISPKPMTSGS